MTLARTYSSTTSPQKNQDVGPSPYQQMSSAFVGASTGPQLKALQYTVLSAVKGTPIIGNLYHGFEYLADPIGELKKDLNISPTISGSIGEAIVSHSVAGAVKVFAVGLGAASSGQISSSLVQNAMTYEWANQAVAAKRNTAKFIVQHIWNDLIKGDVFFDRFIYDKTYLFYKAKDHDGERFARWRNNGLFEDFNSRAEKYGVRLEGAEQKFGAYSFTSVLTDKSHGLVPYLKAAKVGWQVGGPTLLTAAVFPPLAPVVLGWQLINADWEQFVKRTPLIDMNNVRQRIDKAIKERGQFDGRQDGSGKWQEGGEKISWNGSYLPDDTLIKLRGRDKVFRTLSDFFTLRGWYRTFVTGETLKDRAFHFGRHDGLKPEYLQLVSFSKDRAGRDVVSHKKLFVNDPSRDGWKHVAWHKGTNSKIYEKVLRLSNGEMRVRMYKDSKGVWQFASRVGQDSAVSKFWQGAYNTQQFGKTIISRFGLPVALAVVIPNPITYGFAAYSAFKGVGEVIAPLKFLGWNVEGELNRAQMIHRLAGRLGANALRGVRVPSGIIMYENGKSFFRRFFRSAYSVLNPFDMDVGALRGLLQWRDAQWNRAVRDFWHSGAGIRVRAVLIANPWIRKSIDFISRIPGTSYLFKAGGFLLGGVKWIVSPSQALKDKLVDFVGWVAKRGISWALGKAFRAWFSKPLTRWLQDQIIRLPVGSLRRRFFEFLLRRIAGRIPLPKVPGSGGLFSKLVNSILKPIFNVIKDLIIRLIKFIFNLIKKIIIEVIKAIAKAIETVIETVFDALGIATSPIWGTVALIAAIIIAVLLLLALIVLLIILLVAAFLSSTGIVNPYQSPPTSEYLEIRKELASGATTFTRGQTIDYKISYKVKKPMKGNIKFEDKFLVDGPGLGGVTRHYFDVSSLRCESPADISAEDLNPDPEGPSGSWKSLIGTVPYNDPGAAGGPVWVTFHCFAKVSDDPNAYVDGTLINHAVISGEKKDSTDQVAASQWLYVNGGSPSGWPTEHGCFTQGPNTQGLSSSHQSQEAIDIGSNVSLGYNISSKPVVATVGGQVVLVCVDGTYSNRGGTPNVCGGVVDGSYFTTGFGTYVILRETGTNFSVFYAHLGGASVAPGQGVVKGQEIGRVDNTGTSTGPHLHYAFTRVSGARMNQPFIPYYVPACSPDWPDTSCPDAFTAIGDPGRLCF